MQSLTAICYMPEKTWLTSHATGTGEEQAQSASDSMLWLLREAIKSQIRISLMTVGLLNNNSGSFSNAGSATLASAIGDLNLAVCSSFVIVLLQITAWQAQ